MTRDFELWAPDGRVWGRLPELLRVVWVGESQIESGAPLPASIVPFLVNTVRFTPFQELDEFELPTSEGDWRVTFRKNGAS